MVGQGMRNDIPIVLRRGRGVWIQEDSKKRGLAEKSVCEFIACPKRIQHSEKESERRLAMERRWESQACCVLQERVKCEG